MVVFKNVWCIPFLILCSIQLVQNHSFWSESSEYFDYFSGSGSGNNDYDLESSEELISEQKNIDDSPYDLNNEEIISKPNNDDGNEFIFYDNSEIGVLCDPDKYSDDADCINHFAKSLLKQKGNISVQNVVKQLDKLLDLPQEAFTVAQTKYNATSKILYYFEVLLINHFKVYDFNIINGKNLIVLALNNHKFGGIAFYQSRSGIKYALFDKDSYYDQNNFLMAAEFAYLEDFIFENTFFANFFFNQKLYPDDNFGSKEKSSITTRIFSQHLKPTTILSYKVNKTKFGALSCARWVSDNNSSSFWYQDYFQPIYQKDIESCYYYQQTGHFNVILYEHGICFFWPTDIVIIIGCITSFIGLFYIFAIAIRFREWREKNIILLNFSSATFVQTCVLCIKIFGIATNCNLATSPWIGILLNYLILVQTLGVLIMAYLEYKRVVMNNILTHMFLLQACVFAWLVPLLQVVVSVFLNEVLELSLINKAIYWEFPGFIARPLIGILFITFAIFLLVLVSKRKNTRQITEDAPTLHVCYLLYILYAQLVALYLFLSFSYMSTIINYPTMFLFSSQGFIIFLLFIVFNKESKKYCRLLFQRKSRQMGTFSPVPVQTVSSIYAKL